MKQVLKDIEKVIKEYGYFRYNVIKELTPDYSYTIGLTDKLGFELIVGGMCFFQTNNQLQFIFDSIAEQLFEKNEIKEFNLKEFGNFKLINVDDSWISLLMLGALDYYRNSKLKAFQIISTDMDKLTLDTPDMSKKWSSNNIIWKYLDDNIKWEYTIPKNSRAFTNLNALRGERLTEFFRYEPDEWEIFAGNGLLEAKESIRIVPISVIFGLDNSIVDFINDPIGKGKFRDSSDKGNDTWNNWK